MVPRPLPVVEGVEDLDLVQQVGGYGLELLERRGGGGVEVTVRFKGLGVGVWAAGTGEDLSEGERA